MTDNVYGNPPRNNDDPRDQQHVSMGDPTPTQSPAAAREAFDAALADARERTGYAPGEAPNDDGGAQRFGSLSSLDRLKKEAEKKITNYRELSIPGDYRPGWSFIVDCMISGEQLERYTAQSTRKGRGGEDDINATQLNCRILLNHVTEIRENGEALRDERGGLLKLTSQEFIDAMGKTKAIDGLRVFVWDSHIGILVDRVMDAAGYSRTGDNWVDAKPVDPTHG